MRICIATGIYPPEIGGPAYYAKNLSETFREKGDDVDVVTFGILKKLPSGIRHLALFMRLLPVVRDADIVIALDTFSAALPALLAAMFWRKKVIVRTGGDFVWEQYIERTGDLVTLADFYDSKRLLIAKEKLLISITRFILKRVTIVFSSNFQKDIWVKAYGLEASSTTVIPNAIAASFASIPPKEKNFLFYGRDLKLRNKKKLLEAFQRAKKQVPDIVLETGQIPQKDLIEKIRAGYCLILPAISEISPNYILDGLRCGKPFILTKYSEYTRSYPDFGLFVDPFDVEDMAAKIVQMCDDATYDAFVARIDHAPLSRTYADLADDFHTLIQSLI